MKSYGSRVKMSKKLLIWIRKDTSTASYLGKFKRVSVARFFAFGFYPIEGFWRTLRRKVTDPEPSSANMDLEGYQYCTLSCNVKVSFSRNLSLLVSSNRKLPVVTDTKMKRNGSGAKMPKKLLIWIRIRTVDTNIASYL
jgi:hypothetical protein